MSTTNRILVGFAAGFLSHVIFQGALGAALYAAHLIPALPWSLAGVPPLGIPRTVSLGCWAGLWGIAYVLLEPRITAALGRWTGGIAFGLVGPLMGHWFVAQPLRGLGVGGGFHAGMIPIEIAFHAVFGFGLAVLVWAAFGLGRRHPVAPQALRS
ncbi:hypothetical protein [Salinarimonas soli]|uniref:Uncharacterized protein n=1 Tax=Salinarimonas soli TaxID=1638099 RepID=A0A5B2VJ08_9HYPH|nr:hypothetical protein [Salinarimonas soli]KAA2238259.1 hypothetical protein F0L46_06330 [Salinarimonas soli]